MSTLTTVAVSLGSGAVMAMIAVGLWMRSEPLPPAPYDEAADLGPLPSPEENGMVVIAEAPLGMFTNLGWPAEDALLVDREGPPSLEAVQAARAEIEAWNAPPAARARIDEALTHPRVVFPCEVQRLEEDCPVLPWRYAHRTAVALALRDAVMGFDAEALARAERILVADRDVLVTARTPVQAIIAATNAAEAFELVGVISTLIASRDAEALSSDTGPRLDAIERALSPLDPADWSLERGLIGEAIQSRLAADILAPDGQARWGLVAAVDILDRYHEEVLAYARDPEHAVRPIVPEADSLSRNLQPYGYLTLALAVDLPPLVDRFQRVADRALERLAVIRVALAAAQARAESARSAETPLPE